MKDSIVYLGSEQDPDEVLSALTRLPKLVHFLWNGSALGQKSMNEVLDGDSVWISRMAARADKDGTVCINCDAHRGLPFLESPTYTLGSPESLLETTCGKQ